MHSTRKITEDLIYVGGSDRRLSRFENLFPIPRGVSYNSYVLLDDKTVLIQRTSPSAASISKTLSTRWTAARSIT